MCEQGIEGWWEKERESIHAVSLPCSYNPRMCEAEADQEFETPRWGENKSRRLGHHIRRSRLHTIQHLSSSAHLGPQEQAWHSRPQELAR